MTTTHEESVECIIDARNYWKQRAERAEALLEKYKSKKRELAAANATDSAPAAAAASSSAKVAKSAKPSKSAPEAAAADKPAKKAPHCSECHLEIKGNDHTWCKAVKQKKKLEAASS